MAHIKVSSGGPATVKTLMYRRYLVDVHFQTMGTYREAISNGFDKKAWEKKNRNKVIILNSKTCHKCKEPLDKDEYGQCDNCTDKSYDSIDEFTKKKKESSENVKWWKRYLSK